MSETREQLEAARSVMLDWLAHVEDHFPLPWRSLGVSDCVMEEVLILEELRKLDAADKTTN